ncbi:MAG: membrane or secreted protein [Cryomorphaceae bacterium]|nr:MAG: membrane or secreted protein [Cryomorphaceae bacterium]
MNKTTLFILIIVSQFLNSQSIDGAWEKYETNLAGNNERYVAIFSNGFNTSTVYNNIDGEFISTNGGSWYLDGNLLTQKIEFDSKNSERVGLTTTFEIELKDNKMTIINTGKTWIKIDDGRPGELNGAWLMSGRFRDGVKSMRNIDRPRKTMKILSGSRFQWIAYNTTTKQFMGTGGGTYKTIDGKYTEQIEFFSRDNSRVGAKLGFEYKLDDGEWNHMGFSSKGDPLHEIWVQRE